MIGLNAGVIAGIVALTTMIKSLDKNKRLKRFYTLIPFALGILASVFLTQPFQWQQFGLNCLIYASIASYMYTTGKKVLLGANNHRNA